MRLVVVESPYAGEVAENVAYAKECVMDCLRRGEAPYASHLFFTQHGLLDDSVASERELGITAGFMWRRRTDAVIFYIDRGVSRGMRAAWATLAGLKGVIRSLHRRVTIEDLQALEA